MIPVTAASEEKSIELAEPVGLIWAVGFFFAFRTAMVFFCARVLGYDPSAGSAANLGLGLLLLLLVCFQSLGRSQRTLGSIARRPAVVWVFLYLAFSVCSLAWSETVSPSSSLAYWCGLAVDVATVLLLFRAGTAPAVSTALLKGFITASCCLALLAWILPANSVDLRLGDEEFFNTNQIGNLCAVAILFAQILLRRKQGRWTLTIVFLGLTLVRSLSKTTLAAFLLAELFLLLWDKSVARRTKVLLAAGVVVVAVAFGGLFLAYIDIYTSAGSQAESLTGRTGIWLLVGDAAIERPIAGHGLDSMWKVVPPFGPDAFEPRHAENELLQQFYAYGAFGVILLAGIYGSLWLQMRRLPRSPLRIVFLSILVYILVRGLAEAEPFDLLLPLWSIVTLSLLMESVAQEEAPFQVPDPALGSDTFEPASGTLAAEFAPRA